MCVCMNLTKKAEPPPTHDVSRDSGTASANGSGDLLGGVIWRSSKPLLTQG